MKKYGTSIKPPAIPMAKMPPKRMINDHTMKFAIAKNMPSLYLSFP
jgi:hypothetical protein